MYGTDNQLAPVAEKDPHLCQAYGCPLDGTVSPGIGAEAKYYCRYHFQADASEWQALTRRINHHLALIRHARRMERFCTHAGAAAACAQAYHFPGFEKPEAESHQEYTARLQKIVRQILSGNPDGSRQPARPRSEPAVPTAGWRSVQRVLGPVTPARPPTTPPPSAGEQDRLLAKAGSRSPPKRESARAFEESPA